MTTPTDHSGVAVAVAVDSARNRAREECRRPFDHRDHELIILGPSARQELTTEPYFAVTRLAGRMAGAADTRGKFVGRLK